MKGKNQKSQKALINILIEVGSEGVEAKLSQGYEERVTATVKELKQSFLRAMKKGSLQKGNSFNLIT